MSEDVPPGRGVDRPTRGPVRPAPVIVVGVLLVVGVVTPLVVPIYARTEPSLGGIPFFYWYQMLWVFIDAAILFACYRILLAEDRRRRAAVAPPREDASRPGPGR